MQRGWQQAKVFWASILLIGSFLLSACVYTARPAQREVTLQQAVPAFTGVSNTSDFDVEVRKARTWEIIIIGPAEVAKRVKWDIKNNTLTIRGVAWGAAARESVKVIVCTPQLFLVEQYSHSRLYVSPGFQASALLIQGRGRGNINIFGMKSDATSIYNEGDGSIILTGEINLEQIIQHGSGHINVQWVNSDRLTIWADGTGVISLAGVARNLDATLSNQMILDGRYLRAGISYINATDDAVAHIAPTHSLNNLATDRGNIYTYRDPKQEADYYAGFGTIARMVGIGGDLYDN